MVKKKGKKGKKTQEDESQSSESQQQPQQSSSRQRPHTGLSGQDVREDPSKQGPSGESSRQQPHADPSGPGVKASQQAQEQLPQQASLSQQQSISSSYETGGDAPRGQGMGRGRGRGRGRGQTHQPQVGIQPSQSPQHARSERREPPAQQHWGSQQSPPQQVGSQQQFAPPQQLSSQGGPWGQGPTQQPAPVQQQRWGPQQPPRQLQQQVGPQQQFSPPQQFPPPQQLSSQGGPWGPSQAQQVAPVQQPWGSQQPSPRPVGPPQTRQAWGPQQPQQVGSQQQFVPPQQLGLQGGPRGQGPTQKAAPVQQHWGSQQPSPQQVGPPQTKQAWGQRPPPGLPQQPPGFSHEQHQSQISSGGQGDVKQGPVQQPKDPQKGKKQGSIQRGGPQQGPSTSQHPLSAPLSKLDINKPEFGGGDAQFLPLEFFRQIAPGTLGRAILVETNHLPLNLGKLKSALHYDVNIIPNKPKKYLRDVVESFRKKHCGNRYPAFDGTKNLYSSSKLPFKDDHIEDEIALPERNLTFRVEIKFVNNVDMTPLQNLSMARPTPREALQVVDIVLRNALAFRFIPVGRSFFFKPNVTHVLDLEEGMQMYNGFFQSAVRGWKPFLNVDVAHKAFPKPISVTELITELLTSYYQPFKGSDLHRSLNDVQKETLNKFIRRLKIYYKLPTQSSSAKIYVVNGVAESPRDTTFTWVDKKNISRDTTIDVYFKEYHGVTLTFPHLPTLWVGPRDKKILLPLEFCSIVEDQNVNRKLTENQTRLMIRHTVTNTKDRKYKIMEALKKANHNNDNSVRQEFGFSVADKFENLKARVLPPPELRYAGRSVLPNKGVWRGDKFVEAMTIKNWTIICVGGSARPDQLTRFADMIFENAVASGMNIGQPVKPFKNIRHSVNDINEYFRMEKKKKPADHFDVIFVVVPNSGPQYSFVKTAAEINTGCLTQCIKRKTVENMKPATASNILLKVNSKLNGTNHYLGTQPPKLYENCMIMGADVTHPSPDSQGIPSVAAVTASHDIHAFQYNICWRLQNPKDEIIKDLEAIVIEQINFYCSKGKKKKPEKIIFFRDGVSEGQFQQVREIEIAAIHSACRKLQNGYKPLITFLVVQKRHHTRLFPINPRDSEDRNINVPAGTCVDTTITHPFMQDFYLVSHASIQGVARPTKYVTLYDDNNMSNDEVEQLTYSLCHMFTRCTRSVSYPAPTYYAHLAAARAKVYIEHASLQMDNLRQEFLKFQIRDEIRRDKPMFFV